MSDQFNTQQLEEEIKRRYPYPLAATFHRAYGSAGDDDESHDYLLDLFEVALKYCASIALSQYFSDAHSDPRINRDLLALQRPSLGHWQGWLRDILSFYRREGRQLLIPELDAFYTHRDTGPLLRTYGSLRQIMVDRLQYGGGRNLGVATPRDFFELLGDYRNRLAHGVRPSRPDRERVAHILAPAVLHLLGVMRPLADYPLVYISDVRLSPGSTPQNPYYNHHFTSLTSDRYNTSRQPKRLDHIAAYPQQLYLLAKVEDFQPILGLHPFFIFRHCESCNQEQAFVLNESRDSKLDYISYQCTHHFSPTEYLDYMQSLIGNLKITPEEEARLAREEAEQRAREEVERLESERAAQQAREEALKREEARLEKERLAQAEAKRQRDERARRAREETQRRLQEEEEQRQAQVRLEAERLAQAEKEQRGYSPNQDGTEGVSDAPTGVPVRHRKAKEQEAQESDHQEDIALAGVPVLRPIGRVAVYAVLALASLVGISIAAIASMQASDRAKEEAETVARWTATAQAKATGTAIAIIGRTATVEAEVTETAVARMILPSEAISPSNANSASLRALGTLDYIGAVFSVAFSPDGQILASGCSDDTVKLWNTKDGTLLYTLAQHTASVFSVAFSPDGQLLASASDDEKVRLWNAKDGTGLRILEGHTASVHSVAFSPDGQLLASASSDEKVRLWNAKDGKFLHTFEGRNLLSSVAFSPDGQLLASAPGDSLVHSTITLWDLKDGRLLSILEGDISNVTSVAFSPDGQLLVGGSIGGGIGLWNVKDGKFLRTFEGHTDPINSVAFSPDGQLLASASDDSTVRLWNAKDSTLLRTLTGHAGQVWSIAFSPDGKLLASGAFDNKIILWGIK